MVVISLFVASFSSSQYTSTNHGSCLSGSSRAAFNISWTCDAVQDARGTHIPSWKSIGHDVGTGCEEINCYIEFRTSTQIVKSKKPGLVRVSGGGQIFFDI